MDTLSAYGTVSIGRNPLPLIEDFILIMKILLKCPDCSHAFFEGEGCRGCYYNHFGRETDKMCESDLMEALKSKRCKFCGNRIKDPSRNNTYCSRDCWFDYLGYKKNFKMKQRYSG